MIEWVYLNGFRRVNLLCVTTTEPFGFVGVDKLLPLSSLQHGTDKTGLWTFAYSNWLMLALFNTQFVSLSIQANPGTSLPVGWRDSPMWKRKRNTRLVSGLWPARSSYPVPQQQWLVFQHLLAFEVRSTNRCPQTHSHGNRERVHVQTGWYLCWREQSNLFSLSATLFLEL